MKGRRTTMLASLTLAAIVILTGCATITQLFTTSLANSTIMLMRLSPDFAAGS